jgi:hypothetical protein
MGIESKHAYRFDFLKSEEWSTIRAEVLAREKGLCFICNVEDAMNDVHHMYYRRHWRDTMYYRRHWRDTQAGDCHVLCRRCHEMVHNRMDKDELKEMSAPDLRKAFGVLVEVVRLELEITTPSDCSKSKKPADFLREELNRWKGLVKPIQTERDRLKKELEDLRYFLSVDWSDWTI